MQMRGNFCKCGNLTADKHYLAWNPVDNDALNVHVPKSFGALVLEWKSGTAQAGCPRIA